MMSQNRIKKKNINRMVFMIVGVSIPLLHFLVFWVYVNTSSILLAFKRPRTYEWTLDNFVSLWDSVVVSGGTLRIGFKNSLLYFLEGILMMFINLVCSYFLYKKIFLFKTFRIVFYLPAIISGIVLTSVYIEFLKPGGPLDSILSNLGLNIIPVEGMFFYPRTATKTIIFYCIWTGFVGMLYFHGALARIPLEIIEAGKLDGVGPGREIVYIIFPLVWPMFSTMLIFSLTGIFTASGPILLFCPNGEGETMTISFWMFKQVYGSGAYGGSGAYTVISAAGLVLTSITVPIVLLTRKIVEKVPTVEY